MAPAEDVWLLDHALSFAEVSDAVAAMRAYPNLLQRIAAILEVTCQDEAHPDATEPAAAAADSTPCEGAAAEDGAMARHNNNTADDAAAAEAEAHESRAGDDALMQQVVGRLHEVVYEVVFQESAGGQPSTRKHRQAHLGRGVTHAGPCLTVPCCPRGSTPAPPCRTEGLSHGLGTDPAGRVILMLLTIISSWVLKICNVDFQVHHG